MFGFLTSPCRVCNPADHSIYQAYFCGVSTQLSRDYGRWARALTNRDSTFVSLLGASLQDQEPSRESLTCCNPLANRRELFSSDSHARYAAAVTICGLWSKLRDDAEDESGARRRVSQTLMAALERSVGKAEAILTAGGFPVETVQNSLLGQEKLEQGSRWDWNTVSGPTAQAFGNILGYSAGPGPDPRLTIAGNSLGRVIYMLDAVEDQEADRKKGRFNPLSDTSISNPEIWDWIRAEIEKIRNQISGIKFRRNRELLHSILVEGVDSTVMSAEQALESRARRRKKRRNKRGSSSNKETRWYDSCCDPCFSSCCDACSDAICCGKKSKGGGDPDCGCCDCDGCNCCPCGN